MKFLKNKFTNSQEHLVNIAQNVEPNGKTTLFHSVSPNLHTNPTNNKNLIRHSLCTRADTLSLSLSLSLSFTPACSSKEL